jgi:thermitase
MRRRIIITMILLAILFISNIGGVASAKSPDSDGGYAPDRILIKFRAGTAESLKASIHGLHGGKVKQIIKGIDVQVVEVPADKVKEKIKAYKGEANVEYAEPDYVVSADPLIGLATLTNPNDYFFYDQWALNNTGQSVPGVTDPPGQGTPGTTDADIDALEAWEITQGSSEVKIAILDTGIDQDHEDLATKIVANSNFSDSPTYDDLAGHGTHVAGIAAAITNNDSKGIAGIAIKSVLLNGKVLNDSGIGYNSWIASGINWAVAQKAKVINLSLGGSGYSLTVANAIYNAWNNGCIIVAAAGNNGNTSPFYPAYYSNCIAVAATDQSDVRASFSNYGSWVDIAAPGVNIISTYPVHPYTNYYAYASGTSMASPHVAGVAALVWASEYGTSNSNVRSRIQSTADPISGTGTYWQNGRVNALNAVEPTVPNVPPVANNDGYSTNEDIPLTVPVKGVLLNDTDAESDPLTAFKVSSPAHGTLILNADGGFTYTPVLNYDGSDSFTYQASDGKSYSNTANVTISVVAVNDAPVAQNQSVSTTKDIPVNITLTAVDPDNDALTCDFIQPAHGQLSGAAPSLLYTPSSGYIGLDTFTFTANDGKLTSNLATVSISVTQPVPVVLFSDSFEDATFNKWVQVNQRDWSVSTQRATDGRRSAEIDGLATNATLSMKNSLNLIGKTNSTLSFSWYLESSWDAGEYIQLELFYSGTWHATTYSINGATGTGPQENKWMTVTIALDKTSFGGSMPMDFKVRFKAKVSDSSEDGNIDNVRLVAN